MKSDIIAKQFIDMLGRQDNAGLQEYLDGKNQWNQPILAADIISVNYTLSTVLSERKHPTTGILLLHKVPSTH